MDMGDVRGLITIATMATFIGICWWAYSSANRRRFEEDALLPFADEGDGPLKGEDASSEGEAGR